MSKTPISSWSGLSRPSTPLIENEDVDARDKRGHDGARNRVLALVAIMAACPFGSALAHPSVVPHDHPHGVSILPDLMVLLPAAVLVGVSFIVVRHKWRTK